MPFGNLFLDVCDVIVFQNKAIPPRMGISLRLSIFKTYQLLYFPYPGFLLLPSTARNSQNLRGYVPSNFPCKREKTENALTSPKLASRKTNQS